MVSILYQIYPAKSGDSDIIEVKVGHKTCSFIFCMSLMLSLLFPKRTSRNTKNIFSRQGDFLMEQIK